MAVKAHGNNISHFIGISSDIKPVNCDEGATFFYVDTGEQYLFHNGMWEIDPREPELNDIFI